eukprot:g1686.t1
MCIPQNSRGGGDSDGLAQADGEGAPGSQGGSPPPRQQQGGEEKEDEEEKGGEGEEGEEIEEQQYQQHQQHQQAQLQQDSQHLMAPTATPGGMTTFPVPVKTGTSAAAGERKRRVAMLVDVPTARARVSRDNNLYGQNEWPWRVQARRERGGVRKMGERRTADSFWSDVHREWVRPVPSPSSFKRFPAAKGGSGQVLQPRQSQARRVHLGEWPETVEELLNLPYDSDCYPFGIIPSPPGKSQEWCRAQLRAAAEVNAAASEARRDASKARHAEWKRAKDDEYARLVQREASRAEAKARSEAEKKYEEEQARQRELKPRLRRWQPQQQQQQQQHAPENGAGRPRLTRADHTAEVEARGESTADAPVVEATARQDVDSAAPEAWNDDQVDDRPNAGARPVSPDSAHTETTPQPSIIGGANAIDESAAAAAAAAAAADGDGDGDAAQAARADGADAGATGTVAADASVNADADAAGAPATHSPATTASSTGASTGSEESCYGQERGEEDDDADGADEGPSGDDDFQVGGAGTAVAPRVEASARQGDDPAALEQEKWQVIVALYEASSQNEARKIAVSALLRNGRRTFVSRKAQQLFEYMMASTLAFLRSPVGICLGREPSAPAEPARSSVLWSFAQAVWSQTARLSGTSIGHDEAGCGKERGEDDNDDEGDDVEERQQSDSDDRTEWSVPAARPEDSSNASNMSLLADLVTHATEDAADGNGQLATRVQDEFGGDGGSAVATPMQVLSAAPSAASTTGACAVEEIEPARACRQASVIRSDLDGIAGAGEQSASETVAAPVASAPPAVSSPVSSPVGTRRPFASPAVTGIGGASHQQMRAAKGSHNDHGNDKISPVSLPAAGSAPVGGSADKGVGGATPQGSEECSTWDLWDLLDTAVAPTNSSDGAAAAAVAGDTMKESRIVGPLDLLATAADGRSTIPTGVNAEEGGRADRSGIDGEHSDGPVQGRELVLAAPQQATLAMACLDSIHTSGNAGSIASLLSVPRR